MTNTLLSVNRRHIGRTTVVRVRGEVGMTTSPLLVNELGHALNAETPHTVIVDLTAVGFLASSGLAALAQAHSDATETDISLVVVVTSGGMAERALALTALDKMLHIVNDLAEAGAPTP